MPDKPAFTFTGWHWLGLGVLASIVAVTLYADNKGRSSPVPAPASRPRGRPRGRPRRAPESTPESQAPARPERKKRNRPPMSQADRDAFKAKMAAARAAKKTAAAGGTDGNTT